MVTGHDALYPAAIRCPAIKGCDFVVAPSAISGTFTGSHAGTVIPHNYPSPTGASLCFGKPVVLRANKINNLYW